MNNLARTTKRILVVEDEPVIGQLCQEILTKEAFEVEIAINGVVAQKMIEQKQYDICVIDIRTPTMNGTQLYHWLLKEYPQLADRVIFTTGGIMNDQTMPFIEQSGRLFLPKPFTPDELIATVKKALKQLEK